MLHQKLTVMQKLEKELNNEVLINQMFIAIDKIDLEKIKELVTADFKMTAPGITEPLGVDALVQLIPAHYKAFPDWKHNVEFLIAKENVVIAKVMQEGTHKTEFEGIPATNKQVLMAAVYEFTIIDGKIQELWVIEDYLGLYTQLGMELKKKELVQ